MESRKIILYMRLSIDDKQSGSISLTTQKQLLEEKLLSLEEYSQCEIVYLEDNGYSGTCFDRPALNTLLDMVKQREVACILIKDFSRLGRDMLQVGYLMESVFPLFYTRLISVMDRFDSNDHYESTGGLELTFRFMMAETYSKDLGKKISAAQQSKIQKGEYVRKNPFYGYKLDENRHYVIDEDVADNVRLIFDLALQGLIPTEIIRVLFQRNIETPAQHKKKINPHFKTSVTGKEMWSRPVIRNILQDKRYIGTYDGGFQKLTAEGITLVKECDRVSIPNHHPAIISPEVFERVQELLPERKQVKEKRNVSFPLKGKIFCGICNLRLVIYSYTSTTKFYCADKYKIEEFACSKTKISQDVLNAEVLKKLKEKINEAIQQLEDLSKEQLPTTPKNNLLQSIENLKFKKKSNYELLVSGNLSKDEFLVIKGEIDLEIEKISLILKNQNKIQQEVSVSSSNLATLRVQAEEVKATQELTVELAKKFINKITVFPDNSLNIEFMFDKLL